jgi:hypothetical protein
VAETEEFGKRYLQAWRARGYKRCENLIPDLIKEYRAKAQPEPKTKENQTE